jgi:hypothetical protein
VQVNNNLSSKMHQNVSDLVQSLQVRLIRVSYFMIQIRKHFEVVFSHLYFLFDLRIYSFRITGESLLRLHNLSGGSFVDPDNFEPD